MRGAVERRRGGLLGVALPVTLAAALLVLPPLGQRTIVTSDEARFALLARDMITRGGWFAPTIRAQEYRNKPLLYPWSIAAFSLPGGRVTETTAQLPIVLAALGAVLFTFLLGDRLFNRRAGVWAALILLTSYDFFEHSQALLPDMIVVAFGALAGYAFWRAVVEPPGQGAFVGFYAAVAFAVFAKGPMGILPFLVAVAWLVTEHGARGLKRLWSPGGLAVFALVTLAWLVPFVARGRQTFVDGVVREDWLRWYLGLPNLPRLGNAVLEAVMGFVPWTLVLVLPLACVRREWRNPAFRFAFLTFAVPLVVVLLSRNQRSRYLLPVFHGGALLVAWWADGWGARAARAARVVAWLALLGALAAAAAVAEPWLASAPVDPIGGLWWKMLLLAVGAVVVGAVIFRALRAGRPRLLVHGVAAVMALLLGTGIWIYDRWLNESQDFRALAGRIERHVRGGEARVFGGRFLPLDFYLGRALVSIYTVEDFNDYVARPDHPAVVVNGRTWRLIQGQISPRITPVDVMRVRGQDMLIVRRHDDG